MQTLSQAVFAAKQTLQINPIQKPLERVALGTPVQLWNGIEAIVSGHSTCDCNSYRVSWFDRHVWQARHKWINRSCFSAPEKALSMPNSSCLIGVFRTLCLRLRQLPLCDLVSIFVIVQVVREIPAPLHVCQSQRRIGDKGIEGKVACALKALPRQFQEVFVVVVNDRLFLG